MRNLLLTIRFLGSAYAGWQMQPNAPTVQSEIHFALERLTGLKENIYGCSRTDSGVHANMFCLNIKTESRLPCESFVSGLNAYLPDDISCLDCREMSEDFHARYDCKGKEYLYLIHNSSLRDPFLAGRAWQYRRKIDENLLERSAECFIGTHDFSAFCSAGSSVQSKERTVTSFSVSRQGDKIIMLVSADGFLYNMVRIMVGTLIGVSEGKIGADEIEDIISSRDRSRAGITAPPQGLYLNRVFY